MRSLAVLACGVFCGSVFAQEDLELYELRGPVKSVTVKGYHAEPKGKSFVKTTPGWYEGEGEDRSYTFDEKGNLLLINTLDENGREQIEEQFTYENGMLVHHFAFYGQMNYFYDADGVLKETVSRGHGMQTRQVYNNVNGKPTEVFTIDHTGDTIMHEKIEHDANGNLLRWYCIPVDGHDFHVYEITCAYDAGGNRIRESMLTDYSNSVTETTYENDRMISQTVSDYNNGMLGGYEELTYETHGLIAEKKIFGNAFQPDVLQLGLESSVTFSYVFDQQGNWTKKTMTFQQPEERGGETDHYIIERTIVYF